MKPPFTIPPWMLPTCKRARLLQSGPEPAPSMVSLWSFEGNLEDTAEGAASDSLSPTGEPEYVTGVVGRAVGEDQGRLAGAEAGRVRGEGVLPHRLHVRTKRGKALRTEGVDDPAAVAPRGDEAGVAEHGEVLGDGGLGHGEGRGELADGAGMVAEPVEDGLAGGIVEGAEGDCISHGLY